MNARVGTSGQIRRSQVITTYGPGALIDLPRDSAIVGGLDKWPSENQLDRIDEPRLSRKIQMVLGSSNLPFLYTPPAASHVPGRIGPGIQVSRFPEWFVVQESQAVDVHRERSRRLVHRMALDERGRFDGQAVVATRFVRACPKGHVDDIDWYGFVHGPDNNCHRQLWLDESGTSGDLSDLTVRCECGQKRGMQEAKDIEANALGTCQGTRPWLGRNVNESCNLPSRLLIRTASNAYFPQVMSVLSLPDHGTDIEDVVQALWEDLQIVEDVANLNFIKKKPNVAESLTPYDDDDVIDAIYRRKHGTISERPVKQVELDALLAVPEGYGDDVPINPDFHARRLPDHVWRSSSRFGSIEAVIQVHRLREVLALIGFTRFEAIMPDINGEYETDVELAQIAMEPTWYPAVENRGEGVFLQFSMNSVHTWLGRKGVQKRLEALVEGHGAWNERRKSQRPFPGGPYVLMHTFSHLLLQSLAMRCGYPATSIRERIYVDDVAGRYGLLLYTASPDAEGTLGGLVQQARYIEDHLSHALRMGSLCSNDPVCAQHAPGQSMEERWLHGSACHGCALVAETSCEMRNDYLDRALVVPVLGVEDACILRYCCMIESLLTLPSHIRRRLAAAFDTGLLDISSSPAGVQNSLGLDGDEIETVMELLHEWQRLNVSAAAATAWLSSLDRAVARIATPDLVWSGPEVSGLHARDTRRVYEELLGQATRSLWASTYVYFDGPREFATLASRMDSVENLQVRLLLNLQRGDGNTVAPDYLVRQFADRFWSEDWPGERRPEVFYDPRSIEPEGPVGVLHAKAVVMDEESVFVTSANLTEAALDRNIEIGMVVRDRNLALSVTSHFNGLIDRKLLRPLPQD